MGCWTPVAKTSVDADALWQAQLIKTDGSQFKVLYEGSEQGILKWDLTGEHNVYNALSAIVAAKHVGIQPADAIECINEI